MRGVGIVHRKKNGSSGVIYRLNCPLGLGGWAGAICYFLLPADFSLKSLTWLKSIYGFSLHLMAFYSAILKNRLFSVCGSWIVFVLLFFIIIQQKNREKKSYLELNAPPVSVFISKLNTKRACCLFFIFIFSFADPEVGPGVERPGGHEAEAAAPRRPALPQPGRRPAAAGLGPAAALQHQEVSPPSKNKHWRAQSW